MRHVAALILALALALPAPAFAGSLQVIEQDATPKVELVVMHATQADEPAMQTQASLRDQCPDWLTWWLGIIFGQDRQNIRAHGDQVQP